MKTSVFFILFTCLFCINAGAQNYVQSNKGAPDTHIKPYTFSHKAKPQFGPDTSYITLNYDSADAEAFHHNGQSYLHKQGQLMNMYYSYPSDTNLSYKHKSSFYQNYDCINYVVVAFDSLYDPYYSEYYPSNRVSEIVLDTIYVPIIHVNYSGTKDTLELQLNLVDTYGYPIPGPIANTIIIDSNYSSNDDTITLIKWSVDSFPLTSNNFAVTMKYYDASKEDSCWFIYGYGNFTSSCPAQPGITTFANPTHFSSVGNKPFIANSFALWNSESGNGIMPQENSNNNFFPCDSSDKTFHPGVDGANYFQNINIFASLYVFQIVGIPIIYNPVTTLENFPNPFSNTSNITFTLAQPGNVSLRITDLTGRELATKDYGLLEPGSHTELIDGGNLAAGLYFYSLSVNGVSVTRKMVIAR